MSLQNRMEQAILLVEGIREDCHYTDERESIDVALSAMRDVRLYSDRIH